MPYETVMNVMKKFKLFGAKGVTITGGGDPLVHPRINDIISGIYDLGIDIGWSYWKNCHFLILPLRNY